MTSTPDHWHYAITQPEPTDSATMSVSFSDETLPTEHDARLRLVELIQKTQDDLGADNTLADIAQSWLDMPESILLIPGLTIIAACPCYGDHGSAYLAHVREITRRIATEGNPFAAGAAPATIRARTAYLN